MAIPAQPLENTGLVRHVDVDRIDELDRLRAACVEGPLEDAEPKQVTFGKAQPTQQRRPQRGIFVAQRQLQFSDPDHDGFLDRFVPL